MALRKKLTEGWQLTDGILNTFPIGEAEDVLSAAVKARFATDPLIGLNLMKDEWVYNRAWTYSTVFETPTEEDERTYLVFEHLAGKGEVFVNGRRAASFEGGEARVDITAMTASEHNELSVRFQAPGLMLPAGNPMPKLGILGDVWLETGNYITLERVSSRTDGKTMTVEHDITAHTAGKYTFTYTVSLDGALVAREAHTERLPAARVTRTHAVSLAGEGNAAPATGRAYDVRVVVERGGIGCAQAAFEAPVSGKGAPRRVVLFNQQPSESDVKAASSIGADAVCAPSCENGLVDADCLFGVKRVALSGAHFARTACVAPQTLKYEANGEPFWPPRTPLWRLRGGARPNTDEIAALYGAEIAQDGALAARAIRHEQADTLLRYALRARQSGETAVVPWSDRWDSLCGEGVTERGGKARMALYALKAAWTNDVAWPELPEHAAVEPGASLTIPIWAASEKPGEKTVSVSAAVYRADGSCLARTKKTALLDAPRCVDTVEIDVPDDGALIVRCEITGEGGERLSRVDVPVAEKKGASPLCALMATPARLIRTPAGVTNTSTTAALAVGCCLLPGESAPDGEWLNEA